MFTRTRVALVLLLSFFSAALSSNGVQADSIRNSMPAELLDRLPELRERAVALAATDPTFAGTWYDPDVGRVFIAFVSADEVRDRQVMDLLPPELKGWTQTVQVEFSQSDLRNARDRLVAHLGKEIVGVGLDVAANGLVVVAPEMTAARSFAARIQLTSEPRIRFLQGTNDETACVDRLNCGGADHRRGGVSLNRNGGACTSGLSVIGGSTRYSTTNGHCWYGQTTGLVSSGTQTFGGLNTQNSYYPGSYCDCRLITSSGTVLNRVYFSNASKSVAVTSKTPYSAVGDTVRVHGRTIQSNGSVSFVEYSYTGTACGCIINGAALASYSTSDGNSGAAVTSTGGSVAKGVNSGESAGLGRFFEVGNMEAYLGVSVLTS